MKKAKIMMTALAVLAVVGGALAFKAKNPALFYSTDPSNGQCSVEFISLLTTANPNAPDAFTTSLSTAPTTDACPEITVRASN